jgi:TRAP-type C4-dicarboxylate transport system permease small subunit
VTEDPFAPEPEPRTRVPLTVEKVLIAAGMAAIALITAANVFSRYVTNISLAFTEEYSVALMVVVTMLGTGLAVAAGRHIRIGYCVDSRPPATRRAFEIGAMLLVILMFGILTIWGAKLAWDEYRFEVLTPGLGHPQWWYTVWLPVLSVAVMLRALGRLLRA